MCLERFLFIDPVDQSEYIFLFHSVDVEEEEEKLEEKEDVEGPPLTGETSLLM